MNAKVCYGLIMAALLISGFANILTVAMARQIAAELTDLNDRLERAAARFGIDEP